MNYEIKTNPMWDMWAGQVNANYHDGGMSVEAAEMMAGPEPPRYTVNGVYTFDTTEQAETFIDEMKAIESQVESGSMKDLERTYEDFLIGRM